MQGRQLPLRHWRVVRGYLEGDHSARNAPGALVMQMGRSAPVVDNVMVPASCKRGTSVLPPGLNFAS